MKKIIHTAKAPAPLGPYNQAIMFGSTLYMSGQIAIDAATGNLVTDDIEVETHQVMKNLQEVLKAAGMDFSHVLKSSIFVKDLDDFDKINRVYGSYFNAATAPARETVAVAKLPKNVGVEISMIASK